MRLTYKKFIVILVHYSTAIVAANDLLHTLPSRHRSDESDATTERWP